MPLGVGLLASGTCPPTIASEVFAVLDPVAAWFGDGGRFAVDFTPGLPSAGIARPRSIDPAQAARPQAIAAAAIARTADFMIRGRP